MRYCFEQEGGGNDRRLCKFTTDFLFRELPMAYFQLWPFIIKRINTKWISPVPTYMSYNIIIMRLAAKIKRCYNWPTIEPHGWCTQPCVPPVNYHRPLKRLLYGIRCTPPPFSWNHSYINIWARSYVQYGTYIIFWPWFSTFWIKRM